MDRRGAPPAKNQTGSGFYFIPIFCERSFAGF